LSFPLPRRALPILSQIDGRRSVGALRDAVAQAGLAMSQSEFDRDFAGLYSVFNGINYLFLSERAIQVSQSASARPSKRI